MDRMRCALCQAELGGCKHLISSVISVRRKRRANVALISLSKIETKGTLMNHIAILLTTIFIPSIGKAEYRPNFEISTTLSWQDPWGGTTPVSSPGTWMGADYGGGEIQRRLGIDVIRFDEATGNRTQLRTVACVDSTRAIGDSSGPLDASLFGFNATPLQNEITNCSDIAGQSRISRGGRSSTPWTTPFRQAISTRAAFADLSEATFDRYNLDYSLFTEANLTRARFWGSHLLMVDLHKANAVGADFSYSRIAPVLVRQNSEDLTGSVSADFTNAKFDYAYLAMRAKNAKFDGASLRHSTSHFTNGNPNTPPSYLQSFNSTFENADLSYSRISLADFQHSSLNGARFDHAAFGYLSFSFSSLRDVSFNATNLRNVSFTNSTIRSDFSNADIRGARIIQSDLRGSAFSTAPGVLACGAIKDSDFRETNLQRAQLRCAAIHLEHVDRDGQVTGSSFDPSLQLNLDSAADFMIVSSRETRVNGINYYNRIEHNWSQIPAAVKQKCRALCGADHPLWGNPDVSSDQLRRGFPNLFY